MVSERLQRQLCRIGQRAGLRSSILRRILVYVVLPLLVYWAMSWAPRAHAAEAVAASTLHSLPTISVGLASKGEPSAAKPIATAGDETPLPPLTVSDIDAVMQDEILLKAMVQRAKQRHDLSQYSDGQASGLVAPTLPHVQWRRATAAGWVAKFDYDGGDSVVAGIGDSLPGGYTVAVLSDAAVKIKRGGAIFDLLSAAPGKPAPASDAAQRPGSGSSPLVWAPGAARAGSTNQFPPLQPMPPQSTAPGVLGARRQ